MKELFKKIGSILMPIVIVCSTMSFTVSEHFCGDHLVSAAIFSKASTCGMELQKKVTIKGSYFQTQSCCKDFSQKISGKIFVENVVDGLNFHQQLFFIAFTNAYLNFFGKLEQKIIPFIDYSPPLLVFDINVIDQVFII